MTTIGSRAFEGCEKLNKADFASLESLLHIDFQDISSNPLYYAHHLFINNVEVFEVNIPSTITELKPYVFMGASYLTSVILPDGLTTIGDYALYCCSSLTSINIPGVKKIGNSAFAGCLSLESIDIPVGVTSIGERAFQECRSLKYIVIPEGITRIEPWTFYCGDASVESISLPSTLVEICEGAFWFYGNKSPHINSITIPQNVINIGWGAFYTPYSSIHTFKVLRREPIFLGLQAFGDSPKTIAVPYGTKEAYEAADEWNKAQEIIEFEVINIPEEGVCTYCSDNELDFSTVTGLTAYTVSEYNDGKVTLSKIEHVPGGTGVILRGEAGSYELYANSESTAPYTPVSGNMLVGIIDDTLVSSSDNDFTNYILAHGNQGIGFYRIATEGTLTAQKAYLQLPNSTESRSINSISLQFCDNIVSGVSVISDSGLDDEPMYTLQGRRVTSPKKGIYILNGKKVIVK